MSLQAADLRSAMKLSCKWCHVGSIAIYYLLSSIFRAPITTDADHANEAESRSADTCLL